MPNILSQATVFQEFTTNLPVTVYGPLRPHIGGGQAELHRYTAAAEKPNIALGAYNPLQNTAYNWPGQSVGSVVDLSYVQVFLDNAYLQYFQNLIGGADTVSPTAGYANRVRAAATNFVANTGTYPRAAVFGDRDVKAGDAVFLQGGGDTLWTTISAVVADQISGSVASAIPDGGNAATNAGSSSQLQTAGSGNYISLSTISTVNYDGSPTGDVNDVYTLTVSTPSVGGDATVARLAVTTSSGRDNQVSVQPAAFGTAFNVGARGLRLTFTNTNTGNTLTGGAPPTDFIVGQAWQVTVNQAWTVPVGTSGGVYTGSASQKYIVNVTRGGLFQPLQPIAAPTVAPTVNPTGGGASGGLLQAGTYYCKYTWVNANGETTGSPESALFTVAATNIPQLTIPSLPAGVTSASVYLTPTNGAAGTEVRYSTGVVTTTTNLAVAVTQEVPLSSNAVGVLAAPTVTPTVNPTGGGASGGALQTGVFYLKYTFTNAAGETAPSPESLPFTVSAANQPQVTLPALPTGATGISLYITPPGGVAGSECVKYATGIAATTYTMAAAAPKLPPTVNSTSPVASNPAFTPTVTPTGGGATGGKIPAGTYYTKVTYNGTAGETLAGTESALFTIAAGNIPQITNMPGAAPSNAVTFNIYLTPVNGASGSEILYASAQAFPASTFNFSTSFPTTNGAVPGSNSTNPVVSNPGAAPTVAVTGGGASGGLLPPGAYFAKFTFSGKGGETQPSSESLTFTVAAGNIPQVTLPSLPANVTGINLYLTQPAGGSGAEILYAQGINTTTYNLSLPLPVQSPPPGPNTSATFTPANPSVAPTVNPSGGGVTGGNLTAGAYKLEYTFVGNVAGETLASSEVSFTIAAGNIPQVTVPALPGGVTGVNVYLTQPAGASGSETKFPSANNSPGPAVNLNASSGSALVLPTPAVNTATAAAASLSPPQITVTTTLTGGDTSGPTSITAAASNVAVGTLGVLVQFSGNGLRKGDLYTIQATGVGLGPVRTLVLTNNLSSAMQGAGALSLTLYLKKNMTVPLQRLSAPPAVNWVATAANLTLNSGMTAYDPTLTTGGVGFAVPVVSGPDTVLYAHYRAWLATYANSVNVINAGLGATATTIQALVQGLLGAVSPDNPLAYGVYKALLNSNVTDVYFSATGDPTVLANWQNILNMIVGLKNIHDLVPLSSDPNVQAAYKAHIDTQSLDTIGGEWRVGWFSVPAVTALGVVTSLTTSDGNTALATIQNNPLVSGTNYTYVTCTSRNGKFVSHGVQPGDVMRFLYTQDGFGNVSYTSFVVQSVVNEDTLVLSAGPSGPVGTAQHFEVWRTLTPAQVAGNLTSAIVATADQRIRVVWPDQINDGGLAVPGYFLCAALAGYVAGIAPHQGLRNLAVSGFDWPVPRSTVFFSNAQLQALVAAGAVVITSDTTGLDYVLAAHTADQSGVPASQLEQVVRTDDAMRYLLYSQCQQFFGNANVTPTALSMLTAAVLAAIQLAQQATFINRLGSMITAGSINTLRPHATIPDRVVLTVNITRQYPLDDASISILV